MTLKLKEYEFDICTIAGVLKKQASLGKKTAVILGEDTISYRELDEKANRIANDLADRGISKGQVVATYMHNSIDHILAWFACAKLGVVWAPINIALRQLDLLNTLRECGPSAIIIDSELAGDYNAIRKQLSDDVILEIVRGDSKTPAGHVRFDDLLKGSTEEPRVDIHWSDPVGLIFTGGSTGLPKAVQVSSAWYFAGIGRYQEMFQPTPDDVQIGVGQLYHTIGSAVEVLSPIYFGMTSVMPRWFSPKETLRLARKHGGTLSVMVAPVLLALLSGTENEEEFYKFRIIATASAGVAEEKRILFQQRFAHDTLEIYGQTETGPLGSVNQRLWDRPYHSQGKGHGWVEIMIADPYGAACAPDQDGEILLRTANPGTFMLGYYNQPEKYAEATRDLWFHTGDLGHLDARGYLHFIGRMAHALRRRGENVSAIEIEQVIMLHPDVAQCAVVGVFEERSGDDEIVAVVKLREGATLPPLEIIKFCEERIAYFKVPRYVRFIRDFPVSASKGEIERHKLKDEGIADAFDRVEAGYQIKRRSA